MNINQIVPDFFRHINMLNNLHENASLGEVYLEAFKKYAQNVCLHIPETNETLTYSDLRTLSVRTALVLKAKGYKKGDIIATCTHNQKYSSLPVLASHYLGIITTNFDPSMSHLDTVHLLRLIPPKLMFVSEEALEFMKGCISKADLKPELVVFGASTKYPTFDQFIVRHPEENEFRPEKIDHKEVALVLFSSGSTGLPKGICLSHGTIKMGGQNVGPMNITYKNPTVVLSFATFYWISTHILLHRCLINGYAFIVCKVFDPLDVWTIFKKYKVTCTFLAPYNASACLNSKPLNGDCSTLEVVLTGSAHVNEKLMSDLRTTFHNAKILHSYGQTETGGPVSHFDPLIEGEYNLQLQYPTSSGIVRSLSLWKVVDIDTEEKLGPGKEGELRLKSDYFMNGYYKMDSSSAYDSEGYLKTGDLACYNDSNCLFIKDRIKEMFKYKGWHILPAVLEEVLKTHPAVQEAVVIGAPCENVNDGFVPMGVIKLRNGYNNVDLNSIVKYVNERVSKFQHLRAGIRVVESIPKTATSKPKRRDVYKMIFESKLNNS